eukprot:gnl/MRDRNA2_/MRDRNA2_57895_c0_seq2.p1 gnl/MRDRNA2_/MRDRNA2_57895_c0~~gnl/MRDRNA2_/MRDRNA2_57895_c0_seq2.p1  ORF type:complete len:342 (+),score=65.43 gnl/MRDRNA2_/MRDRNA2_57895_c0_seq2:97-1122(+)
MADPPSTSGLQRAKSSDSVPQNALHQRRGSKDKPLSIDTRGPSVKLQSFTGLGRGIHIKDYFELGELITEGDKEGILLHAKRLSSGEDCVMKVRMKAAGIENERVWREVMQILLSTETSAHVLSIDEIYEDDNAFYVVMPKMAGSDIIETLMKMGEALSEAECQRIIREVLIAMQDLHNKGLIHRDVKPENIILEDSPTSPVKSVKLIDFDTCQPWSPKTPKARRFAGTLGYISPESLLGEACPQSDLFAVGVVMYNLICSDMPWKERIPSIEDTECTSPYASKLYDNLKQQRIDWDCEPWPDRPLALDLCKKLLAFDVEDRIQSAQEALKHPWLVQSDQS